MNSIALTGASGFVGRHVLLELQRRGIHTLVLGRRPISVRFGEWRCLDLRSPDKATVEAIAKCQALVHLAWSGLSVLEQENHLRDELPVHRVFLERVVGAGLPSVVVSGTCLEYGMQEGELSEDKLASPSIPYAQAKDQLRMFLEQASARHGVRLCWARLFYVYGSGQSPKSLWPALHAAIARGDATFSMSAGQQVRDFIPIGHAARLIVAMASERVNCGVINLCSGVPVTVEQQVRKWIAEAESKIEPDLGRHPYLPYEPFRFWGSCSKLLRVLGVLGAN